MKQMAVLISICLAAALVGAAVAGPLDGYRFHAQKDAPGVLVRVAPPELLGNASALAALCDDSPPCVAFNTKGQLRAGLADGAVGKLKRWAGVSARQGVWVQARPRRWLGGTEPLRVSTGADLAKLQQQSAIHIAAVSAILDISKLQTTTQSTQSTQTTTSTVASKLADQVVQAPGVVASKQLGLGAGITTTPILTGPIISKPILTDPIITKPILTNPSKLITQIYTRDQLSSFTRQSIGKLITSKPSISKYLTDADAAAQVTNLVIKWVDIYATSWDSRYSAPKNLVSYVVNQGSCGSCTAFATVAVGESTRAAALNRSAANELSEQYLFFCNHAAKHTRQCNNGMFPDEAATEVSTYGFRWSSCYPYSASQGQSSCASPSSASCTGLAGGSGPGGKWSQVQLTDPFLVKAHIRKWGAVVTSFYTNNLLNSYPGGVINNPGPNDKKTGHSVAVIGWDDVGQYWIAKNSWGSWWGELGFFRISYSDPNFCQGDGDYGPPIGLYYEPSALERRIWGGGGFTVSNSTIKLPDILG